MSVRTLEEFVDALDADFAWRQKELTQLLTDVTSAPPALQPLRLRAGIALLYAHWEGFIKAAADLYLEYVGRRRLRDCDLNDGLRAFSLGPRIRRLGATREIRPVTSLINYITAGLTGTSRVPRRAFSRELTNVYAAVFRRVLHSLGLDSAAYKSELDAVIDKELVECRNHVAHGRSTCPSEKSYCDLHATVTGLLRVFNDQLQQAAIDGEYRRPPAIASVGH